MRLNGWQRLWLLLTLLWAVAVFGFGALLKSTATALR